jgi:hypothetical protein
MFQKTREKQIEKQAKADRRKELREKLSAYVGKIIDDYNRQE